MWWPKYLALWPDYKSLSRVCYKRLKWSFLFCWCMQQLLYYPLSTTHVVWFYLTESFQSEKGSLKLKGIYVAFIFYAIPSTSNFCHLICASPVFQTWIRKKIVRSKGGSLMAAKAPKMFPIHHFNSFALSSVMYAFLSKLLPDLARDCTLHFSNFLYYAWPYGTAPNEDTLTPMICASSLIVAW